MIGRKLTSIIDNIRCNIYYINVDALNGVLYFSRENAEPALMPWFEWLVIYYLQYA